jgi:UDP-perosamine 4-acetyltransferase
MIKSTKKPVIIIGTGGHARILVDGLLLLKRNIIGFTDPKQNFDNWLGIPVLGDDKIILTYDPSEIELINGVGALPFNNNRKDIYSKFKSLGYTFSSFIHPSAQMATDIKIGEGCQILANSFIQIGAQLKENVIVNTGAQIDHDCLISSHCHIAPRSILCGGVKLAQGVHIGSSATIIQEIDVGADSIIGAGATVTQNIKQQMVVKPAKCSIEPRRG